MVEYDIFVLDEKHPNGRFLPNTKASVLAHDHGFLYGHGVFEGIRVYNKSIFFLEKHIDRLFKSAKALGINVPLSREELIKKIRMCCNRNQIVDGYIRVVVTIGVGDLGLDPLKCLSETLVIIAETITLYQQAKYENGLNVVISRTRRTPDVCLPSKVKSLNYLNNILGKMEANQLGADECIMLSIEGYVTEGTGDNIFVVKDKVLHTPSNNVLLGITRECVIGIAKRLGIKIIENNKLTKEDLYSADEIFLTGTAAQIIGVVRVGNKIIGNGKPGRITALMHDEYKKEIKAFVASS